MQIVCRNRLERVRLKNYNDSATFFSDFEKTVNELKNAGANVSEKEKLNYMLNALPESYSYIGDLIDTLKEEDQTADYVKGKIQMAELKHQKDDNSGRKTNVFMADKNRTERICFQCGKGGHLKRNCRYGGQAAGSSSTWRSIRGCQEAGRRGYDRGRGNYQNHQEVNTQCANQQGQKKADKGAWVAKIEHHAAHNSKVDLV